MMRWVQQGGAPAPQGGYPAPGHAQGSAQPVHDPYAGYAHADPYAAQQQHPEYPAVRTQPGGPQHAGHVTGYDPQLSTRLAPQYAASADPRGYAAGHSAPAPQGYGQPAHHEDTQNWDLSHYSAHGAPGATAAHGQAQAYVDPRTGQPHYDPAHYQPRSPAGYPPDGQGGQGWANDPQHGGGYGQADPYAQQHAQHPGVYGQTDYQPAEGQYPPGQGYDQDGQYDADAELADAEPPRRGPRPAVVIAALVGAIAVGGGLAYGYRMLGGGVKTSGKPPVVKAEMAPAKVKPADAGGKEVAHTDKKFANRLGDAPPASVATTTAPAAALAASPPSEPEAPRTVRTLIVNKDGTITPQASTQPAAQPAPALPQGGGVPGMVIEGLTPRAPPRVAEPPVTPVAKAPAVADLPVPRAKTVVAAEPKAEAAVPKKRPAPRDDLAAPKAGAAVASAPTGGTVVGFVPVLASKKSREEALKSFADMFQKYPDVLSSKSPDVIEANLADKGVWFRTVVGPPGSREAAREICSKLDAQGFKGCWVTAYKQ